MDVSEIKWNLAACRVNAGLTQEEAAAKLHISPATIVAHERGKKNPTYAQLLAYAQIYNVPVEIINCEVRK
ncbi:XRE family transcriptional regulator [Blautia obeum]|uniref:XRE family transcriptional regulator n=1 Tax=Blautia obeum TaxID=40520 RepID=A0A412EMQ3_9FIRM|nr:helix-turn-helix transcriptional regulator [Blautia obeum]RGI90168.1 XRE family transcriptional regulator [Blautia obeum]RGR46337.1 XRE family transcriptional regulator [Blautia obeum]RGY04140.1 XRE family transcriptional regulator [Blautia obeum]RGZ05617.1 XRE family transcriptional regulator [Blautia obeum]